MKKNLLLVVCAFLICASSTSVSALNAKRVGHGVWYAVLTGTSASGAVAAISALPNEWGKKNYGDSYFLVAILIPFGFGVHGGIKGLAAVVDGDGYEGHVDLDAVVS